MCRRAGRAPRRQLAPGRRCHRRRARTGTTCSGTGPEPAPSRWLRAIPARYGPGLPRRATPLRCAPVQVEPRALDPGSCRLRHGRRPLSRGCPRGAQSCRDEPARRCASPPERGAKRSDHASQPSAGWAGSWGKIGSFSVEAPGRTAPAHPARTPGGSAFPVGPAASGEGLTCRAGAIRSSPCECGFARRAGSEGDTRLGRRRSHRAGEIRRGATSSRGCGLTRRKGRP
jgi:hypothetical protein